MRMIALRCWGNEKASLANRKALTRRSPSAICTFLSVNLSWGKHSVTADAFLDSGAMDCFMDAQWAKKFHIPVVSLSHPHHIISVDGQPLGSGVVKERTGFVHLFNPFCEHFEHIRFFLVDLPALPLVLGHPWMTRHKPHVNWDSKKNAILQWGPECFNHC